MDKKNIDILLKKAYWNFTEKIEPKSIKKILPIAFPVLKSTWRIKIATTEPSGLIDRYILRVLKEFGPCDIKRIDDLLCLGEDRIEHALIEMEKLGSPITHSASGYSFATNGDVEHFTVEQEHDFTFCINGISGDLLPVDFCQKSKSAEIKDVGEDHSLYIKLSSIISGSESKLPTLRSGTDAKRFAEGIPDGFKCLVEDRPKSEFCRCFLSFGVVTADGNMSVFCAGDATIHLNSIDNYLERLPEIGRLLEKEDILDSQFPGLSIKQDGTTVHVKVHDQTLWDCFANEDLSNQSIFLMKDFIRNGWVWDISNWKFSHYLLLPADEKTAMSLFICKASFELEHAYSNLDTRQDAENWLHEYFESFNSPLVKCPNLDVILNPLLKSLNSEVRDFARMISTQGSPKLPAQGIGRSFYHSKEINWQNCIVNWMHKATSSIQIISPVIDSELVFQELHAANQRGVYLQIITSLLDRNGKIKASGDKQFTSLSIPAKRLAAVGASVRATRNVPHAKIIIIDEAVVLFMSANLSDNSLGVGKVNAVETCILLQESSIVSNFLNLFKGIWESAAFIQGSNRDSAFIAQNAGKSLTEIPGFMKGKDECIIFSNPHNLALEKEIIKTIKNAKTQVILMAMSFYDTDQVSELYDLLHTLLSKNIEVTLIVRTGNEQFADADWPDESTKRLLSAGMKIVEVPHLHAKGVIVDNSSALAMSANFNPFSLGSTSTSHIECGLLALDGASWSRQFIAFVNDIIKKYTQPSHNFMK